LELGVLSQVIGKSPTASQDDSCAWQLRSKIVPGSDNNGRRICRQVTAREENPLTLSAIRVGKRQGERGGEDEFLLLFHRFMFRKWTYPILYQLRPKR
jgi:hypothetical protein